MARMGHPIRSPLYHGSCIDPTHQSHTLDLILKAPGARRTAAIQLLIKDNCWQELYFEFFCQNLNRNVQSPSVMIEQVAACRGPDKASRLETKVQMKSHISLPSCLGNGEPERAKMAATPPIFATPFNCFTWAINKSKSVGINARHQFSLAQNWKSDLVLKNLCLGWNLASRKNGLIST